MGDRLSSPAFWAPIFEEEVLRVSEFLRVVLDEPLRIEGRRLFAIVTPGRLLSKKKDNPHPQPLSYRMLEEGAARITDKRSGRGAGGGQRIRHQNTLHK